MRLVVLGSKSTGNGYLLDNGREALMIECGTSFFGVTKAVGFRIDRIAGCIVSHEHGDHCGHSRDVERNRIPLYCSKGTAEAAGMDFANIMAEGAVTRIGAFKVLPFSVRHDAAQPFGFLVNHPDCGNVLFATDTCFLEQRFRNLNNIMIECNYDRDILEENTRKGMVPPPMRHRTLLSHMGYHTCLETLKANDLSRVNHIVLIHLSDMNSDARGFVDGIRSATGKRTCAAERGMIIDDFNNTPF